MIWYTEYGNPDSYFFWVNPEGVIKERYGFRMELTAGKGEGIESWREVTLIYNAALRQMETKMQILNEEFQHVHQYNPIEHIKARIKTPESIVKKLKRYGFESTIDNMVKGAAGQAIQNMNLIFGLPEETGLDLIPPAF